MYRIKHKETEYLFAKKNSGGSDGSSVVEDRVIDSADIQSLLQIVSDTVFNIDVTPRFVLDVNPLLSGIIVEKLDEYVNSINTFPKIWENLCKSKDYNLELYTNRSFPYYKIESKEWVELNINVRKDLNKDANNYEFLETNKDGFNDEEKVSKKDNNFLALSVLSMDKYPDLTIIFNRIDILIRLGARRIATRALLYYTLSPRECHMIFDARYHAQCRELQIDIDLLSYVMFYAMYIARQEETIVFSQVLLQHRFVITLDNACCIPHFANNNLDRDPHLIQLTNDSRLSNVIPLHLRGARCINKRDEFQRRFDLITGQAFRDINLRELNASITGSILIPCVHKSPLEDSFKNLNWNFDRSKEIQTKLPALQNYKYMVDNPATDEDINFLNYAEYFYPSYVSLTDDDFANQVLTQDAQIDKSAVCVGHNQLADVDISITSSTHEDFKLKAYLLYDQIRKNVLRRGAVYITEIKTRASIKYKIYGPGLNRPMDVFRIAYEPIKMVKKFHVPCVRAYYNGDVYMLRACVSSLLSGACDSYKWFSCNKICVDVILKYIQRGISIVLNQLEKKILIEYIKTNPRWNAIFLMYDLDPAKCFGTITQYHPFFYPGMVNCGVRESLRVFERSDYTRNICATVLCAEFPNDARSYGSVKTRTETQIELPSLTMIDSAIKKMR